MAEEGINYNLSFDELFETINVANFLKTRGIDRLLYILYTENDNDHYNYAIIPHVQHDIALKTMMERFTLDELKRLFNDPTVYYNAGRIYLNGKTGTMSAILVNCQFILYEYLLQRGVEINASQDILVLVFRIITLKPLRDLPEEEKSFAQLEINAMCKILKKLYIKYGIKIFIDSSYYYNKICIIDRNFSGDLPIDIDKYKETQLELFIRDNYYNEMVRQIEPDINFNANYDHWEGMTTLFIRYIRDIRDFVDVLSDQENISKIKNFLDEYNIYEDAYEDADEDAYEDADEDAYEDDRRYDRKYERKYLKYKQKYLKYKQQFNL